MNQGPVREKKLSANAIKYLGLSLLGLVVVGAGIFFVGTSTDEAASTKKTDQYLQQVATDIASKVADQIKQDQDKLQALAEESSTISSFTDFDSAAAKIFAEKQNSFDADATLRLLLPDTQEVDRTRSPPLTFASLAMVHKAVEIKNSVPVEWLLQGQKDAHIAYVAVVKDGSESVVGVLHLSQPVVQIEDILTNNQQQDMLIELQQRVAAGQKIRLATSGEVEKVAEDAVAESVKIDGTIWNIIAKKYPLNIVPDAMTVNPAIFAGLAALFLALLAWFLKNKNSTKEVETEQEMPVAPAKTVLPESTAEADQTAPLGETEEESFTSNFDDMDSEPDPEIAEEIDETLYEEDEDDLMVNETQAPASIFRAYDIRGVVDDTLTEEVVYNIGRALGSEAAARGETSVAVGRDGRLSSPRLAQAMARGLSESGQDVIDIGMVPTPVLYFATHLFDTDSGIMITGSHNPPEYNGIKMVLAGETLSGDTIQALRQRILNNDLSSGNGQIQTAEIGSEYIRRITEDIPVALSKSFKVVVDSGNGVAGVLGPQLIRALGHDVIELYCEIDGNFPNHHPDPSQPENLEELIALVKKENADLGMAFDGDGDRLGVVDRDGNIIWADRQMMLFARDVISRNPGGEIIFDVKCSNHLKRVIEEAGGKATMWKTGHSLIKAKMKESGALLAGEMSGHVFFKERWFGFDDGLYTAARLLEILVKADQPPHEIMAALPGGVATPELRLDMHEEQHAPFMATFGEIADFGAGEIGTIDGIRVDFADGWGLIRPSNTTPCLVMRFEADNEEALQRIQAQFKEQLLAMDSALPIPY